MLLDVAANTLSPSGPWRAAILVVAGLGATASVVFARRRQATAVVPARPVDLDAALAQLRSAICIQWTEEEERRRVSDPVALPVRWHPAPADLVDQPANIHDPDDPCDLTRHRLVDVYRSIASRRLVIIGRAGSGKTVLAVRLALDLLADPHPGEPVPVIVNLASWDPTEPLRDWLATQLGQNYSGLDSVARPDGRTLAQVLVDAGHLLPILDGFDEIATGRQREAMLALSRVATVPLVITARRKQFVAAVHGTRPVSRAAGITLDNLRFTDVVEYLPRTTSGAVWTPVLERLRHHPRDPACRALRKALETPLMVYLARTVYSDDPARDPVELLAGGRFDNRGELERHLLAAFVPAAYGYPARRWEPERAERYLRFLAGQATRGPDELAWWRLFDSVNPDVRYFIGVFLGLAVGAPVFALPVAWPLACLTLFMTAFIAQLFLGGRWLVPTPSRSRLSLYGRGRSALRTFAESFGLGAVSYLVVLLVADRIGGQHPFDLWIQLGTGLVWGVYQVSALVLPSPIDTRRAVSAHSLLAIDRRHTLAVAAWYLGQCLALLWLVGVKTLGLAGPDLVGVVGVAVVSVVAYSWVSTAWGQWIIVVRVWLPLRGRLPWNVWAFLDDAHDRGVLRLTGAVHQFRHARLREQLAGVPPEDPTPHVPAARGPRPVGATDQPRA